MSDKPIHAEIVRADQILPGNRILGVKVVGEVLGVAPLANGKRVQIITTDGNGYERAIDDPVARILPEPVEVREFWRCSYEWKRATADFRIEWTKSVYTFQSRYHAEEKLASAWRTHANGQDGIRNQVIEHVRVTVMSREEGSP